MPQIKLTKAKRILRAIFTIGNAILLSKYAGDAITIRCEPCLPADPCPPCRTAFMAGFLVYLTVWNGIAMLTELAFYLRKKR